MEILGTDISVWNDDNSTAQGVDFAKMKQAGARFCFIKATQGVLTDQDYLTNWQAAKSAGMPRGAYMFLDWNTTARKHVEAYWKLLKDDPGEFAHPIIDFEFWNNPPTTALSLLKQVCEEVKAVTGRVPMIYTNVGFFNSYNRPYDTYWTQYPLWIANYTTASKPMIPRPWTTWLFWQWTCKGDNNLPSGKKYGCESSAVDLNRFNGDEAAFRKLFNLGEPAPVTDAEKLARLWAAHPELW